MIICTVKVKLAGASAPFEYTAIAPSTIDAVITAMDTFGPEAAIVASTTRHERVLRVE